MSLPQLAAMAVITPVASFLLGVVLSYEIRKAFARIQSRVGPLLVMYSELRPVLGASRLLQPLYDLLKLWFKETVKPETASQLWFVLSPYAGLILAIGATYFVPIGGLSPFGDSPFSLVIVLYLLIGIALMWVIGAAASSSPWGAIGARREAELMLGFEITTIASIFSVAILARSLSISAIVDAQRRLGLPFLVINPLAALGMIMGTIARLRLKPFDIPDAEVEIVAGPFTEYSGKLLAVIQSTRLLLTSVSVALFVDAFLGGGVLASSTPVLDVAINTAAFIVLCIVTTFMIAAVHTLMPRFRIDQGFLWTLKFAWPLAFSGLALSILLACLGVGC